jgi:RNA polymerase sigma factor (sigma-70 family)
MATRKRNWAITERAFGKLLALFDDDVEQAGEKYERMHAKLTRFFQCRGCRMPHEMSDEVLNRVARKVDEGEVIRLETLSDYFYGVAQNVLREFLRNPQNTTSSIETLPPDEQPAQNPIRLDELRKERQESERRLECLESCVAALSPDARTLILEYYQEEEGVKTRNRRRMANELGIPINALRIRAHRIRTQLEKCVTQCLDRAEGQ